MAEQKSDMIRLGGLWENTSAGGTTYLSGSLGGGRMLVFRNGFKKGENDPDWIIYLAPRAKQDDNADTTRMPAVDSGDIPF